MVPPMGIINILKGKIHETSEVERLYFLKSISDDVRGVQIGFQQQSKTKRFILVALFSSITAVLQSTGGFLPGIGYFISPFATAPILICSMFSLPLGALSYLLTNLLLLILQPSELIVFPFTTGLLGLGTGAAFYFFKKRLSIIVVGATFLTIGIISLLFVFQFPVLGPAVSNSLSFLTTSGIFFFTLFYSWLWVETGLSLFKRLTKAISL